MPKGFQKGMYRGAPSQAPLEKESKPARERDRIIPVPWGGGKASLRLRSGYYQIDVIQRFGERIRESTKENDPVKAMSKLQALLGRLDRGEIKATAKEKQFTIAMMLDEYIVNTKVEWSAITLQGYLHYTKNLFVPRFGELRPIEITSQMISDYRNERITEQKGGGKNRGENTPVKIGFVSHSTVDRELAFFKGAMNWLRKRNPTILPFVPFFDLKHLKNRREGFLTIQQFERDLLPQLPFHIKALACCAVLVGGRKSEWLKLDWSDINFRTSVIHFDHTKTDDPREVPIIPGLMTQLLIELKEHHDLTCRDQKAVFVFKGERLKEFRTSWIAARRRAVEATGKQTAEAGDMDLSNLLFHDTRRSAGKIMRDAGMTQEDIMRTMGHKTNSMFLHYGIKPKDALDKSKHLISSHVNNENSTPLPRDNSLRTTILRLRNEGRSYRDIQNILQCSKSTIAYHCSDERNRSTNVVSIDQNLPISTAI